jgi:PAS domain S-box-containing protein
MAYTYILVLAPVIPLLKYTRNLVRWQQPKLTVLVILSLLPWLGSAYNLLSPYHYPTLDLTPVLLTLTGLTIAWGVPYFRLLHVIPLARDTIIDRMDDGIIILDTEFILIDINPAAARILNTDKSTAVGMAADEILSQLQTPVRQLTQRSSRTVEQITLNDDRGVRSYELKVVQLTDAQGRTEGWLFTLHDVSEREHIQQVLRDATASAEATVRVKDEFMANMSHELRTPLNSIIGYSTLMSQGTYGDLNEEQKDRLVRILDSSKQLLEILNNILDLSRIEADGLAIERQPIAISPLITECLTVIQPLAAQKGLQVINEITDNTLLVDADYHRLRQVLVNLLSNALKFTNDGAISARARAADTEALARIPAGSSDEPVEWIVIEIIDTGIGIADEDLSIIFDEFRQIDGSASRSYQGTGLGLSIARKLVNLMGGRIWVESQPGTGSTFFILMPRSAQPAAQPTHENMFTQN